MRRAAPGLHAGSTERHTSGPGGRYTLPTTATASGGPHPSSPTLLPTGHLPHGHVSRDTIPPFNPISQKGGRPHCFFAPHKLKAPVCRPGPSAACLSNGQLLLVPGSCGKQGQVFNEALPVKGVLNKQMPHLAACRADLPALCTAVIYSPFHQLHSIIFRADHGHP